MNHEIYLQNLPHVLNEQHRVASKKECDRNGSCITNIDGSPVGMNQDDGKNVQHIFAFGERVPYNMGAQLASLNSVSLRQKRCEFWNLAYQ